MPLNPASRRLVALALGLLLAAGCTAPTSVPPGGTGAKADKKAGKATQAPADPQASTAGASAAPTATPGLLASPSVPAAYFGRVLGLDGKPAPNVLVRGYLVANNGAGLITDNGAGIVSNNSGAVVGNNGASYRLAATGPLSTRTGADGTFALASPDGQPLNIEAEADAQTKAIRFDVPAGASGFDLQLAPTGTIAGTVVAEAQAGVTNLVGVDVFIPGTGYLAKTDEAGRYTIANVPTGTFRLLAGKIGLGDGQATGVVVTSRATTQAPAIPLVLKRPAVTALDRTGGAPGTPVIITGEHFQAAAGAPFEVTFGGAVASAPVRQDDGTIAVKVPEGGKSGDVFVAVNGVAGVGLPFTVYKTLGLTMGLRDLGLAQTQVWTADVRDTNDRPVNAPAVDWTVEGTAIAIAPDGTLTPRAAGTATLRAASGSLTAGPITLRVHDAQAVVATLAGGKEAGFVDGLGLAARFEQPQAIGLTPAGDLLLLDNASLRAVRVRGAGQGRVTTVAGDGTEGLTDGEGRTAQLIRPHGVYAGGKVYLLDSDGNERSLVRLAEPRPNGDWAVRTIAGGATGYAEGAGTQALFRWPDALAVDAAGAIYVADKNHRIRKLAPDAGGAYVSTTLVGNGAAGNADGQGEAASVGYRCSLALAGTDTLWVADESNRVVRRVTLTGPAAGTIATIAGSGAREATDGTGTQAAFELLTAIATDAAGNAYVHDYPARIARVTPAGVVTTLVPAARKLLGIDAEGRVYGLSEDFRLVRWDATGQATTLVGNGNLEAIDGPGTSAALQDALGFAIDTDGSLYLSEYSDSGADHRLRRVWLKR